MSIDFNPLPSYEGRPSGATGRTGASHGFQSTPLSRGKTSADCWLRLLDSFQSTPLSRGKTFGGSVSIFAIYISIHSPLTREDLITTSYLLQILNNFNPLPSHEGRRDILVFLTGISQNFNPLPSHEGRLVPLTVYNYTRYFNPLPSHEGRRCSKC